MTLNHVVKKKLKLIAAVAAAALCAIGTNAVTSAMNEAKAHAYIRARWALIPPRASRIVMFKQKPFAHVRRSSYSPVQRI